MTYQFPGERLPVDMAFWHGGPRPRREGGGIWWGGPGWPDASAQVVYANPCPPGTWYSHEAERCLRSVDPFAGGVGGSSSWPTLHNAADFVTPRSTPGKALALVAVAAPLLKALPWPLALAGYLATRFIEPLR